MHREIAFLTALLSPAVAHAGALEDAALALQPGNWVEIPTENIQAALTNSGGSSGNIFGYAEEFKWDPTTRRLIYIGMDHGQAEGERFVAYGEDDNSWSVLPTEPWMAYSGTPSHAYDHHAIDVTRRFFYFRYPYAGRSVYRYELDSGNWTQLADNPLLDYAQCCGAIDYFPELDGIVWVQAGEFAIPEGAAGGVFLYTEQSGSWTRLGEPATYQMGTYQNFAEYLPVHGVVLFGGGNDAGSRKLYKLDANSSITPLADTPIDIGVHQTVHTADPVSGELLVLTSDERFFAYDVTSDTWTELPIPTVPVFTPFYQNSIHGVVAAPIDSYGVIAYTSCEASDCRLVLYRHKEGIPSGAGGSGSSSTNAAAASSGTGSTPAASGDTPESSQGCGCHVDRRPSRFELLLIIALCLFYRRRT